MRLFIVVILVFVIGEMSAQTYEIGAFLGGTNNIGDVGKTNYILPSGIAFGGLFKWNKSKRYAWRGSSREQRGFEIKNSIFEVSAGLEFNFLEYNLHKLGPAFTPYLYTGLTYFRYDFNYFDTAIGELQNLDQRDGSFAIPMIVGLKARINNELILGAEIGARYTFTDNLDASNPEGSNFEQFRFGNIFSDDWYVFSGFTLTYTFGRKPCSDCFE